MADEQDRAASLQPRTVLDLLAATHRHLTQSAPDAEERTYRTLTAAKLNGLNPRIDPGMASIAYRMALHHINADARQFTDFAEAFVNYVGVSWEEARPYLRAAYNGARDSMEDIGLSVGGMDSPVRVATVLADNYAEGGVAEMQARDASGATRADNW